MDEFNSRFLQRLDEITDIESLSLQERKEYYASWKAYNDYANTLAYAKQEGKAEGIKEGKKEGLEEGMERGIKQGIEEGEQKAKFTIAATLKRQGVDVTFITQATGLFPDEINRL